MPNLKGWIAFSICLLKTIQNRDLSDLLMELLAAKSDGYLLGLVYLDTPCSTNPIVEKLPAGLQDKGLLTGAWYKEEHRVIFPPFSFINFVYGQAKARNNPSFILWSSSQSCRKGERTLKTVDSKLLYLYIRQMFLQRSIQIRQKLRGKTVILFATAPFTKKLILWVNVELLDWKHC